MSFCSGRESTLLDIRRIMESTRRKGLLSITLVMKYLPTGLRELVFPLPVCSLKQGIQVSLAGQMSGQPQKYSELCPASWYVMSPLVTYLPWLDRALFWEIQTRHFVLTQFPDGSRAKFKPWPKFPGFMAPSRTPFSIQVGGHQDQVPSSRRALIGSGKGPVVPLLPGILFCR